jgi:G3E family GTPase
LRYADTILLNNCDLADDNRLRSIEVKIRAVREGARIVRTTRCQVALPLILSVGKFQSDRFFADPVNHADCGDTHLGNDGFEALSFECDRHFAADKFQSFLERLPETVFRGKGLIGIEKSETQYVFHLVGQRFTLDEWQSVGPIKNRMVLIGRNLDNRRLREQLENCLAAGALNLPGGGQQRR